MQRSSNTSSGKSNTKKVKFAPNTKKGNGEGPIAKPDNYVKVPKRYYTSEEYAALDHDQRVSLKYDRQQAAAGGHKGVLKSSGKKRTSTAMDPSQIARIATTAAIAAIKGQLGDQQDKKSKRGKTSRARSSSSDEESEDE